MKLLVYILFIKKIVNVLIDLKTIKNRIQLRKRTR
jgi:hypothetical protein